MYVAIYIYIYYIYYYKSIHLLGKFNRACVTSVFGVTAEKRGQLEKGRVSVCVDGSVTLGRFNGWFLQKF